MPFSYLRPCFEVLIGHLPVVLGGHPFGVPQEGGRNVSRKHSGKLRGSGGTQVLPQLGPGGDACSLNDLLKLRP